MTKHEEVLRKKIMFILYLSNIKFIWFSNYIYHDNRGLESDDIVYEIPVERTSIL